MKAWIIVEIQCYDITQINQFFSKQQLLLLSGHADCKFYQIHSLLEERNKHLHMFLKTRIVLIIFEFYLLVASPFYVRVQLQLNL